MEVARRWYLEILSGPVGDDTAVRRSSSAPTIDQVFAADYTNHVMPAPKDGWKSGIAGARQVLKTYRSSFPDLKVEIERQWVEDGKVYTRYQVSGSHTGKTFFGVSANGKHYSVSGLGIDRIENGKIVSSWGSWDMQSLIEQMNVPKDSAEIT